MDATSASSAPRTAARSLGVRQPKVDGVVDDVEVAARPAGGAAIDRCAHPPRAPPRRVRGRGLGVGTQRPRSRARAPRNRGPTSISTHHSRNTAMNTMTDELLADPAVDDGAVGRAELADHDLRGGRDRAHAHVLQVGHVPRASHGGGVRERDRLMGGRSLGVDVDRRQVRLAFEVQAIGLGFPRDLDVALERRGLLYDAWLIGVDRAGGVDLFAARGPPACRSYRGPPGWP